jgi:hypothetical protein
MSTEGLLPVERFRQTLEIVRRESHHLAFSHARLFQAPIGADWVAALDRNPELAERLEAFVSRFGRMQDTIADKLLPRWLLAIAETPGGQIEVLNRAERLGVIENTEQWLQARKLRNRLIHESMESPSAFAADLNLAREYTAMLMETYDRLYKFAATRMQAAI